MYREEQLEEMIDELEEALSISEKTTEYYMIKCRELEEEIKELKRINQSHRLERR